MFDLSGESGSRGEILRAIRRVRQRWRLRVALRGGGVLVAAALGTLLVSSLGLEAYRFTPNAILAFRALTYLSLLGFGWWTFIRPMARRVTDEQVALYLEEHEPSLQTAVLSAVEETKKGERAESQLHSPALVRRLIESAVERVRHADMGRGVEQRRLHGASGWLGAAVIGGLLLILFGPAFLRHGLTALLTPLGSVEAATPYVITVEPGDATVARGSDQAITAYLEGFDTGEATLFLRDEGSTTFERLGLVPLEDPGSFEVLLFDVQQATEYFVEALGVQSHTFTLSVVDLPYVERLEHTYRFPAYTGLEPRHVDDGGDIAVLAGTEVTLRAFPTVRVGGGQLVLDEDTRIALEPQPDGSWQGIFTVAEPGFYGIELEGPDGEMVTASPQYTVDVLSDQPPSVLVHDPGRDTTASAVEELYVEVRADDDFGLQAVDLVYTVNGGDQRAVALYRGDASALREVTAGHTFLLEDLSLEPGDFVAYHARAADRNLAQQGKDVKSDLYFVQIRAFSRDFRAAPSQGGGGGGGGGNDPRGLSEAQKEIVAGTFNVIRDRDSYAGDDYADNVVFLALAQGQLREQVETLLRRMNSRVMPAAPVFREIAEILPQAVAAMQAAERELQDQDADGALPAEQRALQYLQRAEEAYEEVTVQMGGGGGGGGSGGRNRAAEDLADLFELELDKLQNQYETMRRSQQQQADNTVDALMERLRELARRQEREAERQRMRARGQSSAQGSGSAAQRAIAEEAEEAARRLERLARERNSSSMMAAARQLQAAADAMRRAAANNDNLGFAEAAAALDRLRGVQDRLQREQTGRLRRDIEDALRRANRLADTEREVADGVRELSDLEDAARFQRLRTLTERKDAMETEVADLERQIDATSAEFRRDERNASEKLQEAANSIRDNKLKEKIRYTKGVIRSRADSAARAFEDQITEDIDELREHLQAAAGAIGDTERDGMTQALDQTRDLLRGLASLEHRIGQDRPAPGDEAADAPDQQGQTPDQDSAEGNRSGTANGRPGVGDTVGWSDAGGGYGNRRPGTRRFSPDEIRQWRREFRQRLGEAREIRGLLRQEGFDATDLDDVIRQIQGFDDARLYHDAETLARLQTFVLDALRRFEYRLRREVDVEVDALHLAASDAVPPGFRAMIEEYYRALSRD